MGMISLRKKFLLVLAMMFLVLGGTFSYNGYTMIRTMVLKEAEDYVQSALRVAWSEYHHQLQDITRILQLIGGKSLLLKALKDRDAASITPRLEALMKQYGLDFMTVVDREGKVFARARSPHNRGDIPHADGIVSEAMRGREAKGSVLIPREVLDVEGEDLSKTALLEPVPTPKAKTTASRGVDAGMALKAAIPIREGEEQIGLIYGGVLLNRNRALVDQIQETVFHEWVYEGRPLGTVTIFEWDTRIATTVRDQNGARAIGTRVSSEVYDQVLEKGLPWLGKAFVVRDWYLSAYEPIKDPGERIIGIIYVGVLEKKFTDYQASLILRFFSTAGIWMLAALILSYVLLSNFVRPMYRLAHASEQVGEGRYPSKIREETRYREIYHLTRAFNVMVRQIRDRDERLQQMNAELSHRNEDLRLQNRNYMELLGFVVHELKTPINSITFGLSSMMCQSMGQLNEGQRKVAQIIMANASHLNSMIRNYLDLSRIEKGELALNVARVLLEEDLVEPVKYQLGPQLEAAGMKIADAVPPGEEVEADLELMKVVMSNLLSNAVKYGRPDSEIRIEYTDLGQAVQIGVWNEGQGISAANLEQVFTKFSNRVSKDRLGRRGTGLGLFITREIVQRHGGSIRAESEEGKWTRFSFRIPKKWDTA